MDTAHLSTIEDWLQHYRRLGLAVELVDDTWDQPSRIELDDPDIAVVKMSPKLAELVFAERPKAWALLCEPSVTDPAQWLFLCRYDDLSKTREPAASVFVGLRWELPVQVGGEAPRLSCCRWFPSAPRLGSCPPLLSELVGLTEAMLPPSQNEFGAGL
jgi:hypothetical protein